MLSSLHHVYNRIKGKSVSKSIDSGVENESESMEKHFAKMDIDKDNGNDREGDDVDNDDNELTNPSEAADTGFVYDKKSGRLKIVKEDVQLPLCFKGKMAFVLHNVFSKKECEALIKTSEKMGYTDALVNIGFGKQQMMKDVRNNKRCIWDTYEESDRIWQRIKTYIPETWAMGKVKGLNERLRILKYEPGQYFAPHMDGRYRRDNGEQSHVTIQLYLNEGFEGGSTTFLGYNEDERFEVVPKTGMVLVFQHDILHEGSKLISGLKYTIRTDVMYEKCESLRRMKCSK